MTCWQSVFETVGISWHFRELRSGNSSSRRDLLPAFDPDEIMLAGVNANRVDVKEGGICVWNDR